MYDRVIVAHGDAGIRRSWKAIGESLRDAFALTGGVESCRDAEHVAQVWRQKEHSRDLIIVDRLLPGSDDPAAEASPLGAGFELVNDLQGKNPAPACILVGPSDNRLALPALNWPLCVMLGAGLDMAADFESFGAGLAAIRNKRGLEPAYPSVPPKPSGNRWALVDIHLNGARGSYFSLRIGEEGGATLDTLEYPFELDMANLSKVVETSRALRKKISDCLHDGPAWSNYVSQWKREYEELGRSVYTLINRDKFQYCRGRADEVAAGEARLRFILGEDAYDGLWESMFDPSDKWLMLKNTITRRTQIMSDAHVRPLVGGDGTVRMLAIAADVPAESVATGPDNAGWRNFWASYNEPVKQAFYRQNGREPRLGELLSPLGELEQEMSQLKNLETKTKLRRSDGRLAARLDVEFIKGEGKASGKSLAARVEDALRDGPPRQDGSSKFDIVHFAGHAIFGDGNDPAGRGYLVFGDDPETHMVPVSQFAGWLRKAGVQLVYLSCCRSSAARAAFEIADAGIPLAIGFTWDLDSKLAVHFAKAFYNQLLKNDLRVCKAFQSARRLLSDEHGEDDPIWTSPVLVAQPTDWLSVERSLAAVS